MEKTEKQIEKDIYRIIRDSELKAVIRGSVYRDGMRPKNANTEDIVVMFKTGLDGQEQSGYIQIHIYVPNRKSPNGDGELVPDITRIDQLEEVANNVLASLEDTEYLFEKESTPKCWPVEGIEQYFINVILKFRRKTF